MLTWEIIILAFSGLGIFNSLAFVLYLHLTRDQSPYKNIFLQVILVAFVMQITHALLELFKFQSFALIDNLYLIAVYCQGPSMYLFIKKTLHPEWSIWPKLLIIHYLPYLTISLLPYDFDQPGWKEWIAIYLVGCQYFAYILLCIRPYLEIKKGYDQNEVKYFLLSYLFPAFAFLWLTYPFSGITKINYQLVETILHSAFLYYLMFLKIREPKIRNKYKFSGINQSESQDIYERVSNLIDERKLYLDPNITLPSLSKKVTVPVNILSQAINQNAHLNFRDFINTFRIEKAKGEIIKKTREGFTIASVAFDCGFNSLSAFNRAFKKRTGQTPSDYLESK